MGRGEVTEADDPQRFWAIFRKAVAALEDARIPYAVVGSAARTAYGTPASIDDIDLLVRPQEADHALAALERAGFDTDLAEPDWLYKAWREGVLVDVVFHPSRGLELSDEAISRRRRVRFADADVWMLAPEDQVILELASDSAAAPTHWRAALDILHHQPVDWSRLEPRGDDGRDRLIALLLYARTEGVDVPTDAIARVASRDFVETTGVRPPSLAPDSASH